MSDSSEDPGQVPGYLKLSAHMCQQAGQGGYPVTPIHELEERAANGDVNAVRALRMRRELQKRGISR
jgi:hypothetical protein